MGHYIVLNEQEDMEVPGAFINIVLDYLKNEMAEDGKLAPLVGNGRYEWNKSLKVLPLCDLDEDGLARFKHSVGLLVEKLPIFAKNWNDPNFEPVFLNYAEMLLAKIHDVRGGTGG